MPFDRAAEWRKGYGWSWFRKKQIIKQGRHQEVLALFVVLTVFCVSLFAIRFVNAKSNDKQIKLNKKSVTLTVGDSQKLKVTNLPDNAKITWKSSKKSVATVSKKGTVRTKKQGKATVKCRITYGSKKNKTKTLKCIVTVTGKKKNKKSVVYMTKDISPEGLMAVYQKLNWEAKGKSYIHSGGTSTSGFDGEQDAFLESMAEAGKVLVGFAEWIFQRKVV